MPSKSKTIAEIIEVDGDIVVSALDNVDPSYVSDKTNSSTGGFTLPAGTEAQRPASPDTGETRFNSDNGSLEFYDGTTWVVTNLIPNVDSVTGVIVDGISTDLTLALTNATDTITVIFKEGGTTLDTVSSVSVSSGSATVSTTANVHGSSGSQVGDTISISVQNVDGTPSGNAVTKVVLDAPSGGATSDSGGYRTHTFTSTANFTVTSGTSITGAEMFIVAGGGSGGCHSGGGAGAGGLLWYSGTTVDGKSPNASGVTIGAGTHVCTVGAGAARGPTGGEYDTPGYTGWRTDLPSGTPNDTGGSGQGAGRDGGDSSIAISGGSTYTAIGGGGGGYYGCNGYDGGSGGSAGRGATGGSGTSGQGNDGGDGHATGSTGTPYPGGGGGGAKQAGSDGTNSEGGDGGAGYNFSSIFGTSVGDSGNFAGGGGGNMQSSPFDPGEGGIGGGGGGGANSGSAGGSGSANTGGGGGGNQYNAPRTSHSQGGSGFIAIRYQLSNVGAA